MAEERKKLRPTEEMRVVELLVAEWRRGKTTPAYALTEIRRGLDEGFPKWLIEKAGVLVTYSQKLVTPPNVCPVCGDPVAGGSDEYLDHIRTKHPDEWRKLKTDPSYTLRRAEAGPRQLVPIVRRLPTVTIRGKRYYLDARLREYRAVDDPHDRIPLEPEYAKLLGEASEGSVAWNAVVESIIEEKQREAERAGTGILRCRWCGAPYAYEENLEIHERSCPKRGE